VARERQSASVLIHCQWFRSKLLGKLCERPTILLLQIAIIPALSAAFAATALATSFTATTLATALTTAALSARQLVDAE
jgi:hypothetical protein